MPTATNWNSRNPNNAERLNLQKKQPAHGTTNPNVQAAFQRRIIAILIHYIRATVPIPHRPYKSSLHSNQRSAGCFLPRLCLITKGGRHILLHHLAQIMLHLVLHHEAVVIRCRGNGRRRIHPHIDLRLRHNLPHRAEQAHIRKRGRNTRCRPAATIRQSPG